MTAAISPSFLKRVFMVFPPFANTERQNVPAHHGPAKIHKLKSPYAIGLTVALDRRATENHESHRSRASAM